MSQYRTFGNLDDAQQEDFDSGLLGVNERLAPDKVPAGMASGGRNVRMRSGEPTTRLGVAKPGWMNVTRAGVSDAVGPCETPFGVGVYADPNGAGEAVVIAAGGRVFIHRENQERAELALPAGVRVLSRCRMVQAFNLLYLFRGKYLQPLVLEDESLGFEDLVPRWEAGVAYDGYVQVAMQAAAEVAFGPWQRVALSVAGLTVSAVTDTAHGYVSGADLVVRGADQAAYNGRFNISVLDDVTFTFTLGQSAVSPTGALIEVSNMARYWQALGTQWEIASGASGALTAGVTRSVTYFTAATSAGGAVEGTATSSGHGWVAGNWVTITNASVTAYNGTWRVVRADANTFTVALSSGSVPASDYGQAVTVNVTTITSALGSGVVVATATTATAHGFRAGQAVTVDGATGGTAAVYYNITATIISASGTQFTYALNVGAAKAAVSGGTARSYGSITAAGAESLIATQPSGVGTACVAKMVKYGHGLAVGQSVTVAGAAQLAYNGNWVVSAATANVFYFTLGVTALPVTPATGTVTIGLVATLTATGGGATNYVASVTKEKHGFAVGQYVRVEGASPNEFNGVWEITGVTAGTFSYTMGTAVLSNTTASGLITVTGSVVLAGQSPETNPEAWQEIYNVLPNADTGVFMNNRLLVPTAYTPGAAGYDSNACYTKTDFVVGTDILDTRHFFLPNEFRVNQGSADEIVDIVKYTADAAVILKGNSWGVMGGLTGDITTSATLDMRSMQYGGCGTGAAVAAGANLVFASPKRGIYGLQQNQQGQVRSVDTPFSNDLERTMGRVNWMAGDKIRMAWWDDKLYAAVPLDGATGNNAILVYDFRRQAQGSVFAFDFQSGSWDGVDEGEALCVMEFFETVHAGNRRLCFLGSDGWVNMLEECWAGDQVADDASPGGLSYAPIRCEVLSRGYAFGGRGQSRFKQAEVVLGVWGAEFGVEAQTGAAGSSVVVQAATSPGRTRYLKPVGKRDYVEGNANGDWGEPGRGDYSVSLVADGVRDGVELGRWQELTVKRNVRPLAGRYVQLRVSGTQGRVRLVWMGLLRGEGNRRSGVMVG